MFDLRRLRLLRELKHRGTLAAVAAALSYAPSSVSQQLSQLEAEAGVPLLEPVGRRVRLTEQAEILVAHTEAVLERLERAEADIAASLTDLTGTLRIAAFQTAALALVPTALGLLRARHPQLRVHVTQLEPEQALPALAARDFDLVVAEEYPGNPSLAPRRTRRGAPARRPSSPGPPEAARRPGRRRPRHRRADGSAAPAGGPSVGDGARGHSRPALGHDPVPQRRLRNPTYASRPPTSCSTSAWSSSDTPPPSSPTWCGTGVRRPCPCGSSPQVRTLAASSPSYGPAGVGIPPSSRAATPSSAPSPSGCTAVRECDVSRTDVRTRSASGKTVIPGPPADLPCSGQQRSASKTRKTCHEYRAHEGDGGTGDRCAER
ncbi:hypothetical protein SGLAM104S_08713 [Streptomyces glaucescens]